MRVFLAAQGDLALTKIIPETFEAFHSTYLHQAMTQTKQEAFLMLLEPVQDRLWRFVLALTRDHDEADDLMSETILATFERFHTIRNPQAFTSFLFTVATRIHRRKKRRAQWFGHIANEEAYEIPSSDISPEDWMETRLVREAIASLPEKQSETVMLFEISGFSLEEIRAIQGGTLSGVKSRLRRGRSRLTKKLGVVENSGERAEQENSIRTDLQRAVNPSNINHLFAITAHE